MGRDVEAEDVELGADPLGAGHLGQAGAGDEARPVAEVEGQLVGLLRRGDDLPGGLALGGRPEPDVDPGALDLAGGRGREGLPAAGAGPAAAALPVVELGDVEEQVAAGDPAAPPEARRSPMPWRASNAPARTSRSATGRLTRARVQKSPRSE